MKYKSLVLLPILGFILTIGLLLIGTSKEVSAQGPETAAEVGAQAGVGTAFTYQGRLTDGGNPANGTYDIEFKLYDAATDGNQVGSTVYVEDITVISGFFTVALDFGSGAFNGEARWLEIGARPGSSSGAYTTLTPRQGITPVPYALYALSAGGAPGNGDFWALTGNAGTDPATNFLGTTDDAALELKVDNQRSLRIEPASDPTFGFSPNLIGGFSGNSITSGVVGATVAGGGTADDGNGNPAPNRVMDDFGTVGGGTNNQAGGNPDIFDNLHATAGGGVNNTASGTASTVGGGFANTASAFGSTVGGGRDNTASGDRSALAGGYHNIANGGFSTVGGGVNNMASGVASTVGGGGYNVASGNNSTVGGGHLNAASGRNSFAAGLRAKANHEGAFVWADSTDEDFASQFDNQFRVRANGGARFDVNWAQWVEIRHKRGGPFSPYFRLIDTSTGAYLSSSGVWTNVSDRHLKENFTPVNARAVLEKLASFPITSWNYKVDDPSIRHIGPTAQDFYAAFEVGGDDKHISTVDADGVALAAIQGLYQLAQEKDAEITALQQQNAELEARLATLERSVGVTDASTQPLSSGWQTGWLFLGGLFLAAVIVGQRWYIRGQR